MKVIVVIGTLGGCHEGPADHGNGGNDVDTSTSDAAPMAGSDDGGSGGEPDACAGMPGAAPLRRLTRLEYEHSLRDLLNTPPGLAAGFSPDEIVAGYEANAGAPISLTALRQLVDAAESQAEIALAGAIPGWTPCDWLAQPCRDGFVQWFGRRAFRRPLTEQELDEYGQLAAAEPGAAGIQTALAAMLISPNFLYVPTRGEADDPYARAARLSYFVWASTPDDMLLDAAGGGRLERPEDLEIEVRRLLADPRAADSLASFVRQWSGTNNLAAKFKDTTVFPEWTPELLAAMDGESQAVGARLLEVDARLHTLLTDRWAWVQPPLDTFYGLAPVATDGAWVELGPERTGLLARASMLASHAHAAETSWVQRGLFVRRSMLCEELPPPPPDVDTTVAHDSGRLDNPSCSGCHIMMDPIGLGLDDFDAIGAYAPGAAIEQGWVEGLGDAGKFTGAAGLAEVLAQHDPVYECFTTELFRYAMRRATADEDACTLDELRAAFSTDDGDIAELIVHIATADFY